MKKAGSGSQWAIVWRQFKRDKLNLAALIMIVALLVVALIAPMLASDRPIVFSGSGKIYFTGVFDYPAELIGVDWSNPEEKLGSINWAIWPPVRYSHTAYSLEHQLEPPGREHLLGTDDTGRDVLARMIWGARVSMLVGFVAMGITVIIGIIVGSIAGYFGGWADMVILRVIEVVICFPSFFLILAILAFLPPSIFNIMIVIGITGWTGVARLIRGEFLKFRNQDFVVASRALGASHTRIIVRHIIPNAIAPVLVAATFGVAGAILTEAGLSFLGFGVPPPTPSWGAILSKSQDFIEIAWWLTIFPGIAIFITITAFNLAGEGFRDAIDPRMKY